MEILRLESVWKQHRKWIRRPTHLKEAFVRALRGRRSEYQDFWALRDVDLSVERGEFLGVCGLNGAGKSTLLRVVARIAPATHGRITLGGSLATLLELATGFLPELTGRENIFVNGAITGISDTATGKEIDRIIEFADIGDFIDCPVKTYSAGMYMRLGFAIATHLRADLLLIDEILAVGDAGFQKKCLAWLKELRERGTTAVIVSHSMQLLDDLCDRVLWLEEGGVVAHGDPAKVTARYEASL
jgi:ABC-type polysaccharide/polyol phosphate transport system ATPase subunit